MDIKAILKVAKSQLSESEISDVDSEILMSHLLGLSRMDLHNSVLVQNTVSALSDSDVIEEQFFMLLDRRLNHEPVQYLTGVAAFRYLELEVGPGVLVPRPESELLVDAVLAHIKNLPSPVSVIDLGAGSGALALAIATEAPDTRVIAVEKSPEAIYWLKKNVAVHATNVRVVEGDVCDVVGFEPHVALFGGPTGMELPAIFIAAAARLLKFGGVLVIEHTEEQGIAIAGELALDFEDIALHDDLVGRPRWTSAVRK